MTSAEVDHRSVSRTTKAGLRARTHGSPPACLDCGWPIALCLVGLQELVDDRGECGAGQRSDDEHPEAADRGGIAGNRSDHGGTKAAGGVDRGAREADAQDVHEGEREANDEAGEGAVLELGRGDAQDGEHEDEGEENLDDEAGNGATVHAGKAVGAEATRQVGNVAHAKDALEQQRANEGAGNLGDDVADEVLGVQATPHEDSQGYGRVDMAARDVANAIGHGNDGQAKGERGEDVAAPVGGVAPHEHGGATTKRGEHQRADELCDVLLHACSFLMQTTGREQL